MAWAAAREPSGRPSGAEARAHPSALEPAVPARGDGAGAGWGGRGAPAAEEGGAAAQGVQLREPQVPRPGGVHRGRRELGRPVGGGGGRRGGAPGSEGVAREAQAGRPGVEGNRAAWRQVRERVAPRRA